MLLGSGVGSASCGSPGPMGRANRKRGRPVQRTRLESRGARRGRRRGREGRGPPSAHKRRMPQAHSSARPERGGGSPAAGRQSGAIATPPASAGTVAARAAIHTPHVAVPGAPEGDWDVCPAAAAGLPWSRQRHGRSPWCGTGSGSASAELTRSAVAAQQQQPSSSRCAASPPASTQQQHCGPTTRATQVTSTSRWRSVCMTFPYDHTIPLPAAGQGGNPGGALSPLESPCREGTGRALAVRRRQSRPWSTPGYLDSRSFQPAVSDRCRTLMRRRPEGPRRLRDAAGESPLGKAAAERTLPCLAAALDRPRDVRSVRELRLTEAQPKRPHRAARPRERGAASQGTIAADGVVVLRPPWISTQQVEPF